MFHQIVGEATDAFPVNLIDSTVAQRDQGAAPRLEQVGHVIGGGSPGRVVIYSDKGIIPLTDSGDHMDDRNASGFYLAQTGLDLRMIGRDDDQSGPTKAWAGDVSGNAHWIKFVQKSAVDNDAGIEG